MWLFYHTWQALGECLLGRRGLTEILFRSRGGFENLRHEARMQGVTSPASDDLASHRTPNEGQVAEEVEDLVADELVAEAQRSVHHVVVAEDDAVLDGPAASEACGAHPLDVTN